ncbi:MAG: IS4 family transposase [Lewinellaceae bacterium]|nr:IS4 family transposase [Lewinellaceae bacterium]
MNTSLRAYLDAIRQFPKLAMQSPQQYFRRPGKDFTRTRILHLERVAWLNITLLKSTLCVELDRFFDWLKAGEFSPTKSALVQARQKLLPKFFKDMFLFSARLFYECFKAKRWKGMRLWAADGTGFRLPDEEWLGEEFGWHGNQHNRVPSCRLLAYYDLLNQILTAAQFHTRYVAETVVAQRSIAEIPRDVCTVYDRGHASHTIPFLHQHYGSHCIIRMPVGFSNTAKAFVASGKKEQIITERLSYKSRIVLNSLGLPVNAQTTITYRLIRVILPTGEVEVLLTTLLDTKRFKRGYFSEIYRKRWGIETCFHVIKSFLELANFSAYTVNNCWQDIYAHFINYNIQTALFTAKEREIKKVNKRRQHDYKPNRNVAAGLLKRFLVKIMLRPAKELKHWIKDFYRQIIQTMEPIRPEKNKERRRRLMRGAERHIYEANYRRAL